MTAALQPWQILVAALAGWIGQQQDAVIDYLREETRKIEIAGITANPNEAWMMQIGRNLTDPVDGFLPSRISSATPTSKSFACLRARPI